MSAAIRVLEDQVIDQIAAGEVVERPASVVKELVENALDAGAGAVDVTLREGGAALIQVADDGIGMDPQDALMCVERHATSKIREVEDLTQVQSFGFRGEALPSIAAVSRFELLTRPRGEDAGTRVRMAGGTLIDVRQAAAAPGTVVTARDLFYGLPARRAFLRTTATEVGHCVQSVLRIALGRPEVAFTLRHGGRRLVDAPVGEAADRARALLGADARDLTPVAAQRDDLRLRGLVSPPGVHRAGGAGALFLYVNGRWVRDLVLRRAVYQAYRDLVPKGRAPLVVLQLWIPGEGVDVNVHPTKAEVRFTDPNRVAAFVAGALSDTVGRRAPPPHRVPVRPLEGSLPFAGVPAPEPRLPPLPPPASAPLVVPPRPPAPVVAEPVSGLDAELLGMVGTRYAVGRRAGLLWLVDAGRLARRVQAACAAAPGRRLLAPVVVRLAQEAAALAQAHQEQFAAHGLDVSLFSATEVAVRAVPPSLAGAAPEALLTVALQAIVAGTEVPSAWGEVLPVPAAAPDLLAVRTLLAEAAEYGVEVPSRTVDPAAALGA